MLDKIQDLHEEIKKKEETPFLQKFAYLWSRAVILYVFCVSFLPIRSESKEFVNFCLGFLLGTGAATILNYFYGTSAGNRSKDTTMALMAGSLESKGKNPEDVNPRPDKKPVPGIFVEDLDGDGDIDADDLDIARARAKLQATELELPPNEGKVI